MHNRFPRKSRKPLRAVSIARTVEAPQPNFQEFLNLAGLDLGRRADIRTITSTRMTFLESKGIKKAMRRARSDPRDVQTFAYYMSNQLDQYRASNVDAHVNPEKRLKLMGRYSNKLVLNMIDEPILVGQHNKSEELVEEEFGPLPELTPFDAHITIGEIAIGGLTEEQLEYPEKLLSDEVQAKIPETIALNGLQVFLDGKCLKHR